MNLGVESAANRSRVARKVDQHSARINIVDLEAVSAKPSGNRVDVARARAEPTSKLFRGQPMVVVWGAWVFQLAKQLFESAPVLR